MASTETVRGLAAAAGLDLTEDELTALASVWQGLWEAARSLEALDLEEFEPLTTFDPRWRD